MLEREDIIDMILKIDKKHNSTFLQSLVLSKRHLTGAWNSLYSWHNMSPQPHMLLHLKIKKELTGHHVDCDEDEDHFLEV